MKIPRRKARRTRGPWLQEGQEDQKDQKEGQEDQATRRKASIEKSRRKARRTRGPWLQKILQPVWNSIPKAL